MREQNKNKFLQFVFDLTKFLSTRGKFTADYSEEEKNRNNPANALSYGEHFYCSGEEKYRNNHA